MCCRSEKLLNCLERQPAVLDFTGAIYVHAHHRKPSHLGISCEFFDLLSCWDIRLLLYIYI